MSESDVTTAGQGDPLAPPITEDTSATTPADTAAAITEARTDAPVSVAINEAPPQVETEPAGDGYVSALPILQAGDAGPLVMELAVRLHAAGYENSVARGEAPAILTDALMDQVRQYQGDHDHDPTRPEEGGEVSPFRASRGVVDARTWQLLMGGPVAVGRAVPNATEAGS